MKRGSGNWQAWVAAAVAAWTVLDPYLGLRYGGVLVLLAALTRGRAFRLHRTDALLIALAALAMASYAWAAAPETTWETMKNQAAVAALVIGVRVIASTPAHVRRIAAGFLAGCVYSAWRLWTVRDALGVDLDQAIGDERLAVEGVNQNYTAYALATGAALVLLLWKTTPARPARALLAVALAACGYGVYLTGTRGAQAALVALAAWVIVHRANPRRTFQLLTWATAVGLTVLAAGWVDEQITPTRDAGRETGTLNGRLYIWPYARELIGEQPLLGYGHGAFRALNPMNIVAHNALLEVTVGLGLIGAALWCACVYSALIRDTRGTMPTPDRAFAIGGLVAVSAPIFATGNWDQSGAAWIVFALASRAGLLLGGGRGERRIGEDEPDRAAREAGRLRRDDKVRR